MQKIHNEIQHIYAGILAGFCQQQFRDEREQKSYCWYASHGGLLMNSVHCLGRENMLQLRFRISLGAYVQLLKFTWWFRFRQRIPSLALNKTNFS
ncbi:hypothetical protein ABKV19_027544 [Rosa sericea]